MTQLLSVRVRTQIIGGKLCTINECPRITWHPNRYKYRNITNTKKQNDNMENTNKNGWSILGNGLIFAAPWIAMLAGTIAHYWSTNEGVVDLGFTLILITWCAGMTNARCEYLENRITELENKLNENENKD